MKLTLTIHESTPADAMAAIEKAPSGVDGIELRVDGFTDCSLRGIDLGHFRRLSTKPMILTRRSGKGCPPLDMALLRRGIDAGFDLIDVEYMEGGLDWVVPSRDRVLLSHHDFAATPETGPLLQAMTRMQCAEMKLALTPRRFDDNFRILEPLTAGRGQALTIFGMGGTGLYSRILAPFFGSRRQFVARNAESLAAPGQLTFERASEIYGGSDPQRPQVLFAVLGNPAAHSRSPVLHNARFRALAAPAAYSAVEVTDPLEVLTAVRDGVDLAPTGLSITAPFKEDAFRFAVTNGAAIGMDARHCRAVNTLVKIDGRLVAENTDVDGFRTVVKGEESSAARSAAVIGAGGTARAALVALREAGIKATIFSRSGPRATQIASELDVVVSPLDTLERFEGESVINTVPFSSGFELPDAIFRAGRSLIDVNYGVGTEGLENRARSAGMDCVGGGQILEAQFVRQSELFLQAVRSVLEGRTT